MPLRVTTQTKAELMYVVDFEENESNDGEVFQNLKETVTKSCSD
jgi:hypothetical protein